MGVLFAWKMVLCIFQDVDLLNIYCIFENSHISSLAFVSNLRGTPSGLPHRTRMGDQVPIGSPDRASHRASHTGLIQGLQGIKYRGLDSGRRGVPPGDAPVYVSFL